MTEAEFAVSAMHYESTEILNDSPRALRDRWHGDHARYDDLVPREVAMLTILRPGEHVLSHTLA